MPLYVADYIADTRLLTTEQHGAYLLLVMQLWRQLPVPNDDTLLARLTGLAPEHWRTAVRPALESYFQITAAGWIHPWVEHEQARIAARVSPRTRGAERTGATAKQEKPTESTHAVMLQACKSHSQSQSQSHTHLHTEPQTKPKPEKEAKVEKESFTASVSSKRAVEPSSQPIVVFYLEKGETNLFSGKRVFTNYKSKYPGLPRAVVLQRRVDALVTGRRESLRKRRRWRRATMPASTLGGHCNELLVPAPGRF